MKDNIQEQLITARKNQILESAARVFAEKGFHPSTIKDIAKDAGIADGTIYIYFKNKHELLLGIFERMQAQAMQNAPAELPIELNLKALLQVLLRQALSQVQADNFELFRVIMSELLVNAELRKRYQEQILAPTLAIAEQYLGILAAQGLIKEAEIGLTTRAISGMVMGLMLQNIMAEPLVEEHWETLPEFLSELLSKGMEK